MESFVRDLHLFADGQEMAQGCRIRLNSQETLSLVPQLFRLEIHDLSVSSSAVLSAAHAVEVQSFGSILASGEVIGVLTRTESGGKLTEASFSPGYSFRNAAVSASIPPMSVRRMIEAVLEETGTGIRLAAFQAEDALLSRPQAVFGRACDAVSMLAATVNADAYLSPTGLCVRDRTPVTPSLVIPEEQLLAEPVRTADSVILSTPVKGWPLGAWVRYVWKGAVRTGRLISRMIDADSAAGPWRSELEIELNRG